VGENLGLHPTEQHSTEARLWGLYKWSVALAAKLLLTKLGSERLPLTTDLVEVAQTASHSSLGPASLRCERRVFR